MSAPESIPNRLDAYNLLHNGILAFSRAERAGMRVDTEYCQRKSSHLTRKVERLQRKLEQSDLVKHWKHVYGKSYNPNSNPQLANILYSKRKIEPPKWTPSNKGSTDEETLKEIAQTQLPELQYILDLRKLRKTRDTYIEAFLREQVKGYIHPFMNLHTARTFRSSSDSPNLQNIPKRDKWQMQVCRRALLPRPGHQLLEVDFSKLEVSIAACYHKDPTMLEYLMNPNASDMHGDLAYQCFMLENFDQQIENAGKMKAIDELKKLRDAAKNGFVFPQFYGDYHGNNAVALACEWGGLPKGKWKKGQGLPMPDGKKLSDHLIRKGIKSLDDYVNHIEGIENDFWTRRFPVYQQWKEDWVKEYQKKGYFDTLTGFRCKGIMGRNDVINYPIQGSAFHCLLWSFIELDKVMREEGWKTRIVNQIHDAVVLDVHPDELQHVAETVKRITCIELPKAWPWIVVPLDVEAQITEIDGPWSEKDDFELPKVV